MSPTPIDAPALQRLLSAHPDLPADYLAYLRDVGWGETASGRMIYSAPLSPEDIDGQPLASPDVLLLGDDMAGYALGYDTGAKCYGEVSPDGHWQPWPADQGLQRYLAP